jgi:uncharacterized circularly permuted ATP-grasp superfamily protein
LKATYRRFRRERWHDKLCDALRRQPPEWWQHATKALKETATREGIVIYTDAKTLHPVQIHLVPYLVTRAQCQYLHLIGLRIRRVLNRLLRNWGDDPVLQAVLPLSEDERAWLAAIAPKGLPEPATVFERLDTNLAVDDPQWPTALRVLEFNSVGVGCLHFMPIANQAAQEQVQTVLASVLGDSAWKLTTDPRVLLRKTLEAHAKAIGRKSLAVAFAERREPSAGGADEMLFLSEYLQAQGLHAVVVDPRDLEVRDGELVCKDGVVDLVYRDFTLSEVISIEKHGGKVDAIKHAFAHNQVVSGLTGEFDHKSLLELLSNPEFDRYFTPSQRRTFHAFIPWTRLVRERKTGDPQGAEVDLPAYVRAHREALVLKPNRAYGGQDVTIGTDVTQAAWEAAVATAMAQPDAWVAQEFVVLPKVAFVEGASQEPSEEFVTVGFIATPEGIAFVGRSFSKKVVNISRGGSLVPIFQLRETAQTR